MQRGLFAYALGGGEAFDTIYYREPRPTSDLAIVEGAWLLRPSLAERIFKPKETPPREQPETPPETKPVETVARPKVTPTPQPAIYKRVTIETPVDWRYWGDFYRAVIQPLVEAGAEVRLRLQLEASGEIDANLVDLSVKESVVQMNRSGKVEAEG